MSDEETETVDSTEATETDAKDWKSEAEKWQALARKNEERAKGNASAVKELEKLRASTMSETEKAIAEAELRGRTTAVAASSVRLARAELKAAAVGKVEPTALSGFLEYADLSKFVGADGEPDEKAIEKAVKALAGEPRTTDFDGGARTTATKATDMNQLIRQQARLG